MDSNYTRTDFQDGPTPEVGRKSPTGGCFLSQRHAGEWWLTWEPGALETHLGAAGPPSCS